MTFSFEIKQNTAARTFGLIDLPKETRDWILTALEFHLSQMEFRNLLRKTTPKRRMLYLVRPRNFSQLLFLGQELYLEQHHLHLDGPVHLELQHRHQLCQGFHQ